MNYYFINDGSTDSSEDICQKYLNDSRIKLYSKNNNGVSSARNYGLNYATGDWILFVDSDDYLASDTLNQYHKNIIPEQYLLHSKLLYRKNSSTMESWIF